MIMEIIFNTLRPRQNDRHFPDDVFKCIFLNENVRISMKISLMFVPEGPINNIPTLVEIMAWHRPGNKPLSEPMMVRLPTHTCVTRPQWVNFRNLISSDGGQDISPNDIAGHSLQVFSRKCPGTSQRDRPMERRMVVWFCQSVGHLGNTNDQWDGQTDGQKDRCKVRQPENIMPLVPKSRGIITMLMIMLSYFEVIITKMKSFCLYPIKFATNHINQ